MGKHVSSGGQTLRELATSVYGDPNAAVPLAKANKCTPDASLRSGQTITLPPRVYMSTGVKEKSTKRVVLGQKVAVSDWVWVAVQENVFPGTARDLRPLQGKWLYVVSEGKVVITADAESRNKWHVKNELFGETALVQDGKLKVKRGKNYSFFVSAIPLSAAAQARLAKNITECRGAGHLDNAQPNPSTPVLVRDVMAWSLAMHQAYTKHLGEYRNWINDETRVSQLFVASTLKTFAENGDHYKIANDLQPGALDRWFKAYETDLTAKRRPADQYAALLAHWLTAEDYLILEESAFDAKGKTLETMLCHLSACVSHISETEPGRVLAHELVDNETRLPMRQIFTNAPVVNAVGFSEVAAVESASLAIISELAPALMTVFTAKRHIGPEQYVKMMATYLDNLRVGGTVPKAYEKVADNLRRGRPIAQGIKPRKGRLELITRLEAKSGITAAQEAATKFPKGLLRARELGDAIDEGMKNSFGDISSALGAINLSAALAEIVNGFSGDAAMALASSGADVMKAVWENFQGNKKLFLDPPPALRAGDALGKRNLAGAVGPLLGLVTGICDTVVMGTNAWEARGKHDYDAAVAYTIAACAAAGVVVGSAMSAAAAVLGIKGAATGNLVALLAAAILGIASLIAAWLTDNVYEEFAKYCFLGKRHREKPQWLSWSPVPLPTKNAAEEARALATLLSSFSISALDASFGAVIRPGFLEPTDVIEVYLETKYANLMNGNVPAVNRVLIGVSVATGKVAAIKEEMPIGGDHRVVYEGDRIKEIRLSYALSKPPAPRLRGSEYVMRVRIKRGTGQDESFVPPWIEEEDEKKTYSWWVESRWTGNILAALPRSMSLDLSKRVVAAFLDKQGNWNELPEFGGFQKWTR